MPLPLLPVSRRSPRVFSPLAGASGGGSGKLPPLPLQPVSRYRPRVIFPLGGTTAPAAAPQIWPYLDTGLCGGFCDMGMGGL